MDYSIVLRSELCKVICAHITSTGMTQVQAATIAGITEPRLSLVKKQRIEKLSVDFLINVATKLGLKVNIELKAA